MTLSRVKTFVAGSARRLRISSLRSQTNVLLKGKLALFSSLRSNHIQGSPALFGVVLTVSALAVIGLSGSQAAQAPVGFAHLWVVSSGGSANCVRQSSPITFEASLAANARCNTFDVAWDKVNSGDTIRVKDGTYGRQFITGDKSADTYIVGESKSGVIITGTTDDCRPSFGAGTLLCADGNHIWLQDVTVDTNAEDGPAPGSLIAAQNVTYKNVDIFGQWPDLSIGNVQPECVGCDATGFTWDGGTYGDVNPPPRNCGAEPGGNGEPVWVYFPDVTINDITFNKQTVKLEISRGGTCAENDNAHLEFVRLESGAHNFTLSNNTFLPGSSAGSGYIFASATPSNFRIIGNFFADNGGSTWMQVNINPSLIAYNTFSGDDTANIPGNSTWVGNLGPRVQPLDCSGEHTRNVWGGTGSCGTDTFVGSASLGVDSTGHLLSGSPAINAGEVPNASDVCTDSAFLKSRDFDGEVRPSGSACDAGADERMVEVGNLWIEPNAGTCSRSTTRVSFEESIISRDARCGSFDQAYEAAALGDLVMIKNSDYTGQSMNGPAKSNGAQITFKGETERGVTVDWLDISNVSYLTFHNFTLTNPDFNGGGWEKMLDIVDTTSIVLDNVDLDRNYKKADGAHLGGNNIGFTWKNSDVCCNSEYKLIMMHPQSYPLPSTVPSVTNALFENMDVHDQVYGANTYQGEPPHAECWWMQRAQGVTLRNVRTYDCISTGGMIWGGEGNSKDVLFTNTFWGVKYGYQNGVDVVPGAGVGYRGDRGGVIIDGNNTNGTGVIENSFFEGAIVDDGWSSMTVRNTIGGKDWQGACRSGPNYTYQNNIWVAAKCSAQDNDPVSDILTNPAYYVNKAANDWRPAIGAPQIDSGNIDSYPSKDLAGNTRYKNGWPDVGPYEFQEPTANLWMDPNGGSCTRKPNINAPSVYNGAYDDATACDDFAEICSKIQPGDYVLIKGGNYTASETGFNNCNPSALVKLDVVPGESASTTQIAVTRSSNLSIGGFYVDISDAGNSTGTFFQCTNNITLKNTEIEGDHSQGTSYGDAVQIWPVGSGTACYNQDITLDNLYIHDLHTYVPAEDNHTDCVQAAAAEGLVIKNSRMVNCGTQSFQLNAAEWPCGAVPNCARLTDVVIENNWIGQCGTVGGLTNLQVRSNTFTCSVNFDPDYNLGTVAFYGNIFDFPSAFHCDYTAGDRIFEYNLSDVDCPDMYNATTNPTGTNRKVTDLASLFVNMSTSDSDAWDLHLKEGATSAIDIIPTSANTDNQFATTDIDGGVRPYGSGFDFGADEYGAESDDVSVPNNPNPDPGDTTPPTVSLTAPTGTQPIAISGNTTLSATASDNIAVSGVQFKLDGANLGSEDTQAPYELAHNFAQVSNGNHTLTATARDAANNSTTSSGVTIVVSGGLDVSANLMAAYNFNEGTGTTSADISGHNNTATLTNGATWATGATPGRYSNGLSLDGTNDYATAADSSSLDIGTVGTISAWAKFDAPLKNWQTLIAKGSGNNDSVHNYTLQLNATGRPQCALGNGSTAVLAVGSAPAPTNAFVHYACAWNTTALKLYVDGVEAASTNLNGLVPAANTSALTIGQYVSNDYLDGIVDDVRIYNVTLAIGDINNDMTTALVAGGTPPPTDTTPPTGNLTTPASSATVRGNAVTLTSNSADTGSGVASARFERSPAGTNTWTTVGTDTNATGGYTTTWNTTSGTPDGLYDLRVITTDNATNTFTSPLVTNVRVDNTNPTTTLTAPTNNAHVRGSTLSVTATATDTGSGIASVQFRLDGANLGTTQTTPTTGSTYTTTWNTTTASAGTHTLQAIATDAAGNSTTTSSLTVTVDNVAPTGVAITAPASGAIVDGTIPVSASASDNIGVAGVQFKMDGMDQGAEDTSAPYSINWNTTTLAEGQHTLSAVARDAAGNTTTAASITVTVDRTTPPPQDNTAPSVPANLRLNTTTTTTTIPLTWNASTDNAGGTGVAGYKLYRSTTANGTYTLIQTIDGLLTYTDGNTTPLTPNTTYYYKVASYDNAPGTNTPPGPNESAQSAAFQVTTASVPAPTVSFSASPASVTTGGASTLSWSTTNATSCSASAAPATTAWNGTKTTGANRTQSLTNLTTTTTYTLTCSNGTSGPTTVRTAVVTVTAATNGNSNTPTKPKKRGDVDNSGRVDILDLGTLLQHYGTVNPTSDVDESGGPVDIYDLGTLLGVYEG